MDDAPQTPREPTAQQPAPTAQQPAPNDRAILEFLAWRYDRLQTLFQFALAALIILCGAVNVFLYKQMRLVRVQLPAQRDAVIRSMAEFQKKDDLLIRNFVAKLQDFAGKNPDLQPMLDYYRPHLQAYFLPVTPAKAKPAAASTNKP